MLSWVQESQALRLLQELDGGGAGRSKCSRRKTPNLFGQAALMPEGLGAPRGKAWLPDTLNYNSGALCV